MTSTTSKPMLTDGPRDPIMRRRIELHRRLLAALDGTESFWGQVRAYRAAPPDIFETFTQVMEIGEGLKCVFFEHPQLRAVSLHTESQYDDEGGYYTSLYSTLDWDAPEDDEDDGADEYAVSDALCSGISGDAVNSLNLGGHVFNRDSFESKDRIAAARVVALAAGKWVCERFDLFLAGPGDVIYPVTEPKQRGDTD